MGWLARKLGPSEKQMRKQVERAVASRPPRAIIRIQGTLFDSEDQTRRFEFFVSEMKEHGYEFESLSGGAIAQALFRRRGRDVEPGQGE